MSTLPRRTATAGLLTLALLGAPSAALAAGPDGLPAQAGQGQQRAAEAQPAEAGRAAQAPSATRSATPSAAAQRRAAGSAGGAAAGRSAAGASNERAGQPAKSRADKAQPAKTRSDKARSDKAQPAKARDEQVRPTTAARTEDPRGNNGTFKVDGPVLDTSHGNEPHVSCEFRLNFFGYDAGQLADISFTAIAPTRGATTGVDGLQLISSSTAKGGQYDGSYPVTGAWTAADLGLDPTQRHHVKVSVESVNADGSDVPGGAKHKVFWLEPCGGTAVAEVETVTEAPPAPADEPVFGPRAISAAPPAEAAAAAPGTAVLSASVSAQAAAPATVVAAPASLVQPFVLPPVSARASAPPATLPFTGSPQLLALLLAGVVTLAGGSALLVAVRRAA